MSIGSVTMRTAFFAEKSIPKSPPRDEMMLGRFTPVKQVTFSGMGVMTFVVLIAAGLAGGFGLEWWEQWRSKKP